MNINIKICTISHKKYKLYVFLLNDIICKKQLNLRLLET